MTNHLVMEHTNSLSTKDIIGHTLSSHQLSHFSQDYKARFSFLVLQYRIIDLFSPYPYRVHDLRDKLELWDSFGMQLVIITTQ